MSTYLGGKAVDGPPPIAPLFGLLQAGEQPAAGVRFVIDTEDDGVLELPPGVSLQTMLENWPANVAPPVNQSRERWLNGVEVYPYPPNLPVVWDGCGHVGPDDAAVKPYGTNAEVPKFSALTLVEPITCTAQQVPDQAAFKGRATRVLAAVAGYAVEREFMTGEVYSADQPFLADGNGEFPNGDTPTRPNDALQLLEEQIAYTGRLGLIHCSPMFATALLGSGFAIADKTGVIRTINGNVVIPGSGYAAGSTPVGHVAPEPREEWVYATGPIDLRRSEVFTTPDTLTEALDRGLGATNDIPNVITYYAEQFIVADWDAVLQAAVLADRCMTTCGIPS